MGFGNYTGRKIGKLTLIGRRGAVYKGNRGYKVPLWHGTCDCGNTVENIEVRKIKASRKLRQCDDCRYKESVK